MPDFSPVCWVGRTTGIRKSTEPWDCSISTNPEVPCSPVGYRSFSSGSVRFRSLFPLSNFFEFLIQIVLNTVYIKRGSRADMKSLSATPPKMICERIVKVGQLCRKLGFKPTFISMQIVFVVYSGLSKKM